MLTYPGLHQLLTAPGPVDFGNRIEPILVRSWLDDYECVMPANEIVTVRTHGFSYLFDIANERLIAAWGISQGRASDARDASRMKGYPLSDGPLYHRGHAIPHRLGGPLDINLVPQLGSVNVGAFRALEKEAVATQGALYFTYWVYGPGASQRPVGVEQGLLCPGKVPRIRPHGN
jgi:hypothetical protein